MARLRPFFPKSHGRLRVDDWIPWSRMGVLARIMEGLASGGTEEQVMMIDATYLGAHRTA